MAHRNWARGSAPPSHSWEWVGVEKPPQTPPTSRMPKVSGPRKPGEALIVSETVTIVAERKRPWPKLLIGGLLAAALGYAFGSRRK